MEHWAKRTRRKARKEIRMNQLIRPARDYRAIRSARRRAFWAPKLRLALEALGFLVVLACLVGTYIMLAA